MAYDCPNESRDFLYLHFLLFAGPCSESKKRMFVTVNKSLLSREVTIGIFVVVLYKCFDFHAKFASPLVSELIFHSKTSRFKKLRTGTL